MLLPSDSHRDEGIGQVDREWKAESIKLGRGEEGEDLPGCGQHYDGVAPLVGSYLHESCLNHTVNTINMQSRHSCMMILMAMVTKVMCYGQGL